MGEPSNKQQVNDFQRAVVRDAHQGDFAHLAEITDYPSFRQALTKDLPDLIVQGILLELATSEGCEDIDEARARLQRIQGTVDEALESINRLATAPKI